MSAYCRTASDSVILDNESGGKLAVTTKACVDGHIM